MLIKCHKCQNIKDNSQVNNVNWSIFEEGEV